MGIRGSLEPYHGICARFFGREEAGFFLVSLRVRRI